MNATIKSTNLQTVVLVNDKPAMCYRTKVEGKAVLITKGKRRMYRIAVEGKEIGYIAARSVLNAVGRVETADSVKTLKAMVH